MTEEYRLAHRAPGPEEDGTTVRLDQVGGEHDEVFPTDVKQHPKRYGAQHPTTIDQVQRSSGKPDAVVQVWRAVPEGVKTIHPGDWVALSEQYARSESLLENGQVITATVRASQLWSEGLLEEWGYNGKEILHAEVAGVERSLSRASFPKSASPLAAQGKVGGAGLKQGGLIARRGVEVER